MSTLSERFKVFRSEFRMCAGYALISAVTVGIILLIVRHTAAYSLPLVAVGLYFIAAIAAHLVADAATYLFSGFNASETGSWRSILNVATTFVVMALMFVAIDAGMPGNTFTITSTQAEIWATNCLLAALAVGITWSFAHSGQRRSTAIEIAHECKQLNDAIARRNAEHGSGPQPIVMNQYVYFEGNKQCSEVAVCDIICARRSGKGTVLTYRYGNKTLHSTMGESIDDLVAAFANFDQMVRCHSDFIVNIDRIAHIKPNGSNGYILKLRGTKQTLPVSGKYRHEMCQRLTTSEK